MTIRTTLIAYSLITGSLVSGTAHAVLQGRDLNGSSGSFEAYYDTGLNVTWLANANLAATNSFGVTGIQADGSMNWTTAQSWIGAMNTAGYLGYNDWRLPTVNPISGTFFNYNFAFSGSTDTGYNIGATGSPYAGSQGSELSFLFYNSLANMGARDLNGASRGCGSSLNVCLTNAGPFQNLMPDVYWAGSAYLPVATNTWYFDMETGYQDGTWEGMEYYALAIRSGDVVAVPEAQTYALMLAGLGLIGWRARRRG